MAGLGQTVSELMLKRMRDAATMRAPQFSAQGDAALTSMTSTGSNPGHLKMLTLIPAGLPRGAPLVVVLHGCTQTAASYDAGSGWSSLAQRHGFALLYPEQQSSNNHNMCFNWFQPNDVTRDHGEVASIAQMVQQLVSDHGIDPARVYVTGLSAGGAMTAAMLATYPELFAGGAIIAGLPFGAASDVSAALSAMRQTRSRTAAEWGDLVRHASNHRGSRPMVQIWHGAADTTVNNSAMDELAKQWCNVAGVDGPGRLDEVDGAAHRAWFATNDQLAVETFLIPRMGHGVPLHSDAADFDESVGMASPYMLEAGINSTRRIAQSWGLLTQASHDRSKGARRAASDKTTYAVDLGGLIQGVLRRAGLNG